MSGLSRMVGCVLVGTLASAPVLAAPEACVSRPVSLIVPYPAGGLADLIARGINQPLAQELGQPVIVENVAGASGALATRRVLSAPADGQTIFLGTPNEVILAPLGNAAVTVRAEQFRMLGPVTNNPLVLLARSSLPVSTLDDVVEYARNPAHLALSYGSVGYGSLFHFAGEDLAMRTGAEMTHVPYKGGPQVLQELAGGLLDIIILPMGGQQQGLADKGLLKFVGWLSPERSSLKPELPSSGESRYLKGFDYSTWTGLMVREDTPADKLACLHQALANVLVREDVLQAVRNTGSIPAEPETLEVSARRYQDEAARFRALAKSINLEPQ